MKNDHPEINGMSLRDVGYAIGILETNLDSITPERRPEFEHVLELLRERKRRLEWTEHRIEITRTKR